MHALPLQEYINPVSGVLNLAANMPPESQKTDLGPFVYISYGRPEDVMGGDFLTKLCYHAYDMVCIQGCVVFVTWEGDGLFFVDEDEKGILVFCTHEISGVNPCPIFFGETKNCNFCFIDISCSTVQVQCMSNAVQSVLSCPTRQMKPNISFFHDMKLK